MNSKIQYPLQSKEMVELIGIIIGDGCIRYKPKIGQYYIEIAGNMEKEIQYYNYISYLVNLSFSLKSKIFVRQRSIRLRVYSKKMVNYLINYWKLPYNSEKCANVRNPNQIINNSKLISHCIRGIVDTDGSIFLSKKGSNLQYPSIEISTISKNLAYDLRYVLKSWIQIGFREFKPIDGNRIYRISINGNKRVTEFVQRIGFSNPRNIKTFKKIKMGALGLSLKLCNFFLIA